MNLLCLPTQPREPLPLERAMDTRDLTHKLSNSDDVMMFTCPCCKDIQFSLDSAPICATCGTPIVQGPPQNEFYLMEREEIEISQLRQNAGYLESCGDLYTASVYRLRANKRQRALDAWRAQVEGGDELETDDVPPQEEGMY